MNRDDYQSRQAWASERRADVQEILSRHLALLSGIRLATPEEDRKKATDFVVESDTGTIACRIRDTKRDFRDFTIRARLRGGGKTELAKLREGYARWYFYAWAKPPDARVGDYVLIDMDRVRACGLLDVDRREYVNDDGLTSFVAISVDELRSADCLRVDECKSACPAPCGNHVPAPSVRRVDVPHAEPIPPPKAVTRRLHQGSLFEGLS